MGPQAGSRILIVDDVEDNRVILRRSLRNFDCTVAEAADGMTALQMIGLEAYDLVLLDVMMPGLDGFEVLARLRLRYTRDELPVIMVTARTTSQDILQAFESGANDYLTKPVERKVALARIAVQLESLHARRALQHSLHQMESLNRTLEQEIIARKVQEERADHMAFHDPLTGLANWMLLRDRIGFALRRSEHHSILSALVLLDLLEFRAVNETHGHAAGDAILSAAAGRLTNASREGDVVARIGSNRFAVLLNGLRNPADAEMLAANLRNAITGEYALPDAQIAVQANAGVALAPTDGATSDLLLENANLALNQARGDAPGALCFFEADMNTRSRERRRLQNDLEKALLGNQFELYFQPFYNLDRDAVTGCEALLRWKHPTRGMVSPLDFIPLAEKTGFIVPLGEWALYKACNFAAQWPNDRKIAVNISPVQFRESNFVEIVEAALRT
ncbi:MAG: diguanylate cyclase, partial [Beijerinckiaceae bacterium]